MRLGEHLARLRERAGLTIENVMEQLDLGKSSVYWLEGPNSSPSIETLQGMLRLYKASDADRLLAFDLAGTPRKGKRPARRRPKATEASEDEAATLTPTG